MNNINPSSKEMSTEDLLAHIWAGCGQEIHDQVKRMLRSAHETTDRYRSFTEWAAGASCDDEYAPRAVAHIAAMANDTLGGDPAIRDTMDGKQT